MKECFKIIEAELNKSKEKINSHNSKNLKGLSAKVSVFNEELSILNKTIPNIVNKYARENQLTETEKLELKNFIDSTGTRFIQDLKIPGINPNFKINIQWEKKK